MSATLTYEIISPTDKRPSLPSGAPSMDYDVLDEIVNRHEEGWPCVTYKDIAVLRALATQEYGGSDYEESGGFWSTLCKVTEDAFATHGEGFKIIVRKEF